MSGTQIVVLVIIAVIVLAVAAAAVLYGSRRGGKRLQERFGPEYDRTVAEAGSKEAAEKELLERERRHAELTITPISDESRTRYTTEWERIQATFIDSPVDAVAEADELVTQLVAERGYPTENYEEQLRHLSVEHANTLGHYRDAHEISVASARGEASTEQLRKALVHYRALFGELLGTDPVPPASPASSTENTHTSHR
ncbi:hypothetical protein ACIA8K_10885 [Catenuloplanes sp. NPDC051500]|uniref:hypothetical protein n=1 Tax=Catenuloplanes sp. NPDC051500 TaxID=3363959 RepID=UPI0037A1C6B8